MNQIVTPFIYCSLVFNLFLVLDNQVFFWQDQFAGKLHVGQQDDGPLPVGELFLENSFPTFKIAFVDEYPVAFAKGLFPLAQDDDAVVFAGLDIADFSSAMVHRYSLFPKMFLTPCVYLTFW